MLHECARMPAREALRLAARAYEGAECACAIHDACGVCVYVCVCVGVGVWVLSVERVVN